MICIHDSHSATFNITFFMSNNQKSGNQNKIIPPRGTYMFLGMKGCGKTTFFTAMCKLLQHKGNNSEHFKFEFIPRRIDHPGANSTYDYITYNWDGIEKQYWPDKTDSSKKVQQHCLHPYMCELTQKRSFMWDKRYTICNIDYPGEAFRAAFSPNGTYDGADDNIRNIATLLKLTVKDAKGIFLLIDAQSILTANDDEKNNIDKRLSALFRHIREQFFEPRVAVIFNKMELYNYPGADNDVHNEFKNRFSNAYTAMQKMSNKAIFFAYPFGKLDYREDGTPIPPRHREPKNILEIAEWVFDIGKGTLTSQ